MVSAAEVWFRYLEIRQLVEREWANAWLGAHGIDQHGVMALSGMAEQREYLARIVRVGVQHAK